MRSWLVLLVVVGCRAPETQVAKPDVVAVAPSTPDAAVVSDATQTPDAVGMPSESAIVDDSTWVTYDAKHFSFRAPPGMVADFRRGIDSWIGESNGDGMRLSFDYGGYGDKSLYGHRDEPSYGRVEVRTESIGGASADLGWWIDDEPVMDDGVDRRSIGCAVYVPTVPGRLTGASLQLHILLDEAAQLATCLYVLRSITFTPRGSGR